MREISFFKAWTDKKEEELLLEALSDNEGKFVNSFETDIKKYFDTKCAVSTNNGAAAIYLALCALGVKKANKVICSVNSFPHIAGAICALSATPVLCDINTDDFNINVDEFEKILKNALTNRAVSVSINKLWKYRTRKPMLV